MNLPAAGYPGWVRERTRPTAAQAGRSIAAVAGVVAVVLTLLVLVVYAVAVHDIMPQMH